MFPVIQRELAVASRLSSTFWFRTVATLLGFVMSIGALFTQLGPGGGVETFWMVTGLSFVFAALSGFWLTADSLSGERRDGTLPLLYLTRLSRAELVISKMTGASLRGIYTLVALLPVIAIPVLAGGVTGREQWQVAVMLVLMLALSLCAGILASVLTEGEPATYAWTAALLFAPMAFGSAGAYLLLGLLFARRGRRVSCSGEWMARGIYSAVMLPLIAWGASATGNANVGSPLLIWNAISTAREIDLIASAVLCLGTAFGYLGGAIMLLPWRAAPEDAAFEKRAPTRNANPVGDRPLEWLLHKQAPGRGLVLGSAVIGLAASLLVHFGRTPPLSLASWMWVATTMPAILLAFAIARYAGGAIAVMRSSGFAEVLVTTPVTFPEIILTQAAVAWKNLRWALILALCSNLLPAVTSMVRLPFQRNLVFYLFAITNLLIIIGHFITLIWVAIYFGWSKGRAGTAAGWTLLWVMIPPVIAATLISAILMRVLSPIATSWTGFLYPLCYGGIYLLIYGALIRWAKSRLGLPPSSWYPRSPH